ncbi:hypothetical protein T310_7601 [Rasamsonia emersonii CBS 393.64]|uniref:Uncharacterized protein n=1 Tax=Rasamsonia emersonii (strain ATCC 16479 / CBS 393.64 / IMI 116815) TaxID=1408163 RepID=A0A0F4YJN6_RASE3|nr:hypothetical protein T310_7601 [Rasamsonia emersonii CBS 393.64]KKA18434.1 hypothetical protein T310_7601 [Rasamsonia emersonii CBS 393.64]
MRHSTKDTPSSRAIRNTITLDNRPLQPIERSVRIACEDIKTRPQAESTPSCRQQRWLSRAFKASITAVNALFLALLLVSLYRLCAVYDLIDSVL